MNFQALIKALIKAGWTQKQIAESVGCSQPNIARLLKDKKAVPNWPTGDALVTLARDECPS
jgi:transcriptional regulator with XRE-family HTH domain